MKKKTRVRMTVSLVVISAVLLAVVPTVATSSVQSSSAQASSVQPSAVQPSESNEIADPVQGATLWANHCGRCHNHRNPGEFTEDEWRPVLAHMRVRSGLTGPETKDILAYMQQSRWAKSKQSQSTKVPPVTKAAENKLAKAIADADADNGKEIFSKTCFACHGMDGKGMLPGMPDLTGVDSPLLKPDGVLMESLTNGVQREGSALAMPPKGGNPNLSKEDLYDVLRYMMNEFKPK